MNDTLELQSILDPTTKAQAQKTISFPIVVKVDGSRNTLILSKGREVEIWKSSVAGIAHDYFLNGRVEQIPLTDFISELEAIIAEVKKAHALENIKWEFPYHTENGIS